MVRSPIFILVLLLCLFSCKDKPAPVVTPAKVSKKENTEAKALQKKADSFFTAKRFDSAYYYFNESKEIFEIENDTLGNIPYNLIQMGYIQQIYGDYDGSDETITQALSYIKDDKKNNNYLASIYNNYGIASKEATNYDDAVNYYKKAIEATKDTLAQKSPLNNLAAVYIIQKDYQKAIPILQSILNSKVFDVDTLQSKKARILDNLGYALYKSGQNDKGLSLMNQGLKIRNTSDSYGSIESYLHLSDYFKNFNPQKSNEYAKTAYRIATEHNSIDERLKSLAFLMESDFEKDARKYASLYRELNDSIIKVRNNKENQFSKVKFSWVKIVKDNQKLKIEKAENLLDLERARNQVILSVFGMSLLIFSIIIVIIHFRNKSKIEKQKAQNAVYDTETRISKKLHDELANEVFQVMSFAETQDLENPNKKEVLLDNLDKIYSNTRNISRENSSIDTGENFGSHLKQMLANYENGNLKVIINSNGVDWEKVRSVSKIAIFRVLQELMVNMKKHSKCSIAIISFEAKKDTLEIRYSDNGIGIGDKLNYKNGLHNAENRINAINGTITFDEETEKGFKAKISIPN